MKHESYPYVLYKDSVPLSGTVTLNLIGSCVSSHHDSFFRSHRHPICHKISRRAPRQRFLSTNHIRYFLANHNCRGVQIPGDNLRHNRRIHHAQAFQPVYAAFAVNHGHLVVTHFAGTARMEGGFGVITHELIELLIRLTFRAGADFAATILIQRRLMHDLPGDANCVAETPASPARVTCS